MPICKECVYTLGLITVIVYCDFKSSFRTNGVCPRIFLFLYTRI